MNSLQSTIAEINKAKEHTDSILCSYSGGKDSLITLDLCVKNFRTVKCFFMYFVKGLESTDNALEYARQRWGIEILQYPHWILSSAIGGGCFCNCPSSLDKMDMLTLKDIYSIVRHDTGIQWIATGAKKSDSMWRRRNFYLTRNWVNIMHPVKEWNKFDVMAYLKLNNIPVPDSSNRAATGIDLSTPSLLWLHDSHPDDFKKLLKIFPFAEAVIKRREYYDIQ